MIDSSASTAIIMNATHSFSLVVSETFRGYEETTTVGTTRIRTSGNFERNFAE